MTGAAAPRPRSGSLRPLLFVWICVAGLLAHRSTFAWLWGRFEAPDSFYGHGVLVPLVALYLAWRNRVAWRAARGPGSAWALVLWIPALALHAVGVGLNIGFASGLALWLMLVGSVWLIVGARALRAASLPLGFLLFALPVPMFVVARTAVILKGWVMLTSHAILRLLGTGVTTDGSFLVLPGGGRLLVDDECCGLRSLIALIALGTVMAATSRGSRGRRWMLALLSVPISLVANLSRVLLLSGIALFGGPDAASRYHDLSAYVVYLFAIGCYVGIDRWLGAVEEAAA